MAANPREITRREEEDGATRAEEEKAEKEEEEEVGVEAVIGAIADDASPPLSAPRASSTLIPLSLRRVDARAIAEIIRSQLERARRAGSERAGEAFARFFELWFDSPFFFSIFHFFCFSLCSLSPFSWRRPSARTRAGWPRPRPRRSRLRSCLKRQFVRRQELQEQEHRQEEEMLLRQRLALTTTTATTPMPAAFQQQRRGRKSRASTFPRQLCLTLLPWQRAR